MGARYKVGLLEIIISCTLSLPISVLQLPRLNLAPFSRFSYLAYATAYNPEESLYSVTTVKILATYDSVFVSKHILANIFRDINFNGFNLKVTEGNRK